MDEDTLNSVLFKLNQVVDKMATLEYKFDLLNNQLGKKSHKKKEIVFVKSPKSDNITNSWTFTDEYLETLPCIFKVLETSFLKKVRKVCRNWNVFAVEELAGSRTFINLQNWTPLDQAYSLLEGGVVGAPPILRSLLLSYQLLRERELEVQLILREFGQSVTTICLECPRSSFLTLVLEEWCPYLEELVIVLPSADQSADLFPDEGGGPPAPFALTRALPALSTLELRAYSYTPSASSEQLTTIMYKIISLSPNLSSLKLNDTQREICRNVFPRVLEISPTFCKSVQDLTIHFCSGSFQDISELFMPKLRRLCFGIKTEMVTPLVQRYARHLEHLSFGFPGGSYFEDDPETERSDGDHSVLQNALVECPDFNCLRVLRVKAFLTADSSIRRINFGRMWKLQVLYLNVKNGDLDSLLLRCNLYDPLFSLRKLTVVGTIGCALSFQILVTLFPNVDQVLIGVAKKFLSDYTLCACVQDGLGKFTALRLLKKLGIYFNCKLCDGVGDAVSVVGDLPNLREFEFGNFDEERLSLGKDFVEGVLKLWQVSRIKLVNVVLSLSEAKRMMDELASRNIVLELSDDIPFLQDL